MEERRTFLIVAWAFLLALFLWSVQPVLSPVVLFLALAYMLGPLFGTALYRRILVTLGVLLFLYAVDVAGTVLAPFALAFVLAYVAHPLVDALERRRVGRAWGSLAVLVVAGLLIALAAILLVPVLTEQGAQFLRDLPKLVDQLLAWYRAEVTELSHSDLPILRDVPFEQALEVDAGDVGAFIAQQVQQLHPTWETAVGLGKGVQTALTIIGYLILTPVLTYYLLRDFSRMQTWVADVLPPERRERTLGFLHRYDVLLGEFLRGQLVVAAFVGVATAVGFTLIGFPNAVLLGVVAGVFNIVPYLGLVVSLIPAVLIALATPAPWVGLFKVAVVFFAVQSLDGYFLSPRIVGERVGLHPVWVMLAIILAGTFLGIVGLLLAIPIAVLIKLMVSRSWEAYRDSVYYQAGEIDDDAPPAGAEAG